MTQSMFRVLGVVASVVVSGAASAADAPAVQWKVSDGGNGHWYLIPSNPSTWEQSALTSTSIGGSLLTLQSSQETTFIRSLTNEALWIGLFQDTLSSDFSEPSGGWKWRSGEPLIYTNWRLNTNGQPNEPNNIGGNENYCCIDSDKITWNDATNQTMKFCVEWSADCNGDGSVDYGQIQSGELADTNNNGVPDVCELVITSVQPISGASTGGTAVRINGNNFPNPPVVTIGGVAATDIVRLSPSLITAVTPAGTPGMAVVAVNSASSESFYYRPSCDGDLDNNGTIDSSDLGLMLVNYGNCYESLATPQQQEPFILQSVETPSPLLLNKK